MDEERGGLPGPVPRRPMSAPTALLGILIAVSMAPSIAADEASIGLAEAAEQGTFNVGTAHAVVARVSDPAAGGEVLKLTYTIPRGTTAGVYAKGFPAELRADRIDLVRVGVKRATPEQGRQVTAAIEIKGSAGIQRIALELQPDWHPVRADHRLAGHRNGEGSRRPGQRHQRSRARHRHAPDRCPVRATLSSPPAQHVIGGADSAASSWPAWLLSFLVGLLRATSGRRSWQVAETEPKDSGSRSRAAASAAHCSSRISSRASASC